MASGNGKRGGGGDRVLESRHLVGLFLGVVLLCGVFFTLGYVMGHTQYTSGLRAFAASSKSSTPSEVSPKPLPVTSTAGSENGEWDFYSTKRPGDRMETPAPANAPSSQPASPAVVPKTAASKSETSAKSLARYQAPRMPRGAIVLQLAALTREGDALALTDALQQKKFPAFVVTPTADNLYRVQVGPYADLQSANLAKRSLEREGFKAITKR